MNYGAKPLTAKEAKWVERLDKVLQSCPSKRLELYTIGDPSLTVIDGIIMRKFDLEIHDGNAEKHGIVLGYVKGGPSVHGVSG